MPQIKIESRFWTPASQAIRRITKRMLRAGGPEITWTIAEGPEVPIRNADGEKIGKDRILIVDFNTLTPSLPGGWKLVGVIDHGPDFNVVSRVPGEDHDMVQYVNAAPHCDHCNTKRVRAKTYILKRPKQGVDWNCDGEVQTVAQIGSTCIRDFLGQDFNYILRCTHQLLKAVDEDDMMFKGKRVPLMLSMDIFLNWVAFIIRVGGWASKKDAKLRGLMSTSDMAYAAVVNPGGKDKLLADLNCLDERGPSKEDKKNATDARTWAAEMHITSTEWAINVKNMAKEDYFPTQRAGYVASIVSGYYMHKTRIRERTEKYDCLNEHLTTPLKSRVTLPNVRVVYDRLLYTAWGEMHLYKFITEDRRVICWFSSRDKKLKVDQILTLKGTVKKLSEFEGNKETVLTRCVIGT